MVKKILNRGHAQNAGSVHCIHETSRWEHLLKYLKIHCMNRTEAETMN